jgi:hypothetical protein
MMFRTVLTATIVTIAAGLQTGGARHWPANDVLRSQICIERPGDNGRLNIHQSEVVIEGGPILMLIGEQAACAYVQPGRYRVWAQSIDPYDKQSTNHEAWKSAPVIVTAPAEGRVELVVCGTGADSTYTNWKISRTVDACRLR